MTGQESKALISQLSFSPSKRLNRVIAGVELVWAGERFERSDKSSDEFQLHGASCAQENRCKECCKTARRLAIALINKGVRIGQAIPEKNGT